MKCLRCQHENAPTMKFCGECGMPLSANPSGAPAPSYAEITGALSEAREQQTATAEILRVISSSPTDVQPVFAAVLRSAARLCDAFDATIFQVDGDELRLVAHEGPIPSTPVGTFPLRGTAAGRAVLDRRTIHVPDLQAEVDEYPESSVFARSYGFRTVLNVPLLRGAEAIGTISIRRTEVRPFTDRQIELLKTFADQAMIAIENVRLFQELQARNREQTEALERETATSGIRAIAMSPTDSAPVFEAILESALRLCKASIGAVCLSDGQVISTAALRAPADSVEVVRATYPRRLEDVGLVVQAIREGRIVHVADALQDSSSNRVVDEAVGLRGELTVPMWREGRCIGAIAMARPEPGLFAVAGGADPHAGRPGRHRDRERAPVHGTAGEEPGAHGGSCSGNRGPGAADGARRHLEGHLLLSDGCPARVRGDRRERRTAVRGVRRNDLQAGWRSTPARRSSRPDAHPGPHRRGHAPPDPRDGQRPIRAGRPNHPRP